MTNFKNEENKTEQKVVEQVKIQMPKKFFYKFVEVLKCQSNHRNEKIITHYVTKELDRLGISWEIDNIGNILATKGKAEVYPCVASHLDTVHDFVTNFRIVQQKGNLFAMSGAKQVGIGGDDKCGVFACLYYLEKYENIKAVFFTSEEVGTIGAYNIDLDFFKDCGYIIEIDRKGYGDLIDRYGSDLTTNGEFDLKTEDIQDKYEYKSEFGLMTDVFVLFERGVGISVINLSCGYYNPHRSEEYINVNQYWKVINFVDEMITALGENKYEAKPEKTTKTYEWFDEDYYDGYGNYRTYDSRKPNVVTPSETGYVNKGGVTYYEGRKVTGPFDEDDTTDDINAGFPKIGNTRKNEIIHDDEYGTWFKVPD